MLHDQVREILSNIPGVVVAGGAARSMALGSRAPEPADIDVFVLHGKPAHEVDAAVRGLGYMSQHTPSPFSTVYVRDAEDLDVQVVFNDGNAGREWRTADDVIATFGWTTEMFVAPAVGVVRHTDLAGADTENRVLVVNHIIDPVRLAYRAAKYGAKGYTIKPSEMQKIFDFYIEASDDQRRVWRDRNANNKAY